MASPEVLTTKKRLLELLEESPWNVKDVAELFVKAEFFKMLETAFKEEFNETHRLRLLTMLSLAPKELLQQYKTEILQLLSISNDRSSNSSSKNWSTFSASLTGHILKHSNTKYDDLLKQESEDILNKNRNVESKFDHSFVPMEFMYMERSELPELIKKCATREIVEKHFVPTENNNNNNIKQSNSATKRKLVEKPQIQRYDIPYHTLNNNNKKQKVLHTTTTTDNNSNNSNNNNNSSSTSQTNNNNHSNSGSSNNNQGLQKHYCEQIELYMQNADRAVLTNKRIKIIKDFMANPKDPRYKQRLCAVPLTKKLVEQTDVSLKFELSLFIFNFKAGTWHYKDKKYKKVPRQPQSSVINPFDVRRSGSAVGGTPSYYGMSPSPSASPPIRGESSPGFYTGSPPY